MTVDYAGLPEGMARLLALADAKREGGAPSASGQAGKNASGGKKAGPEPAGLLELVGGKTLAVPGLTLAALNFIGEVTAGFGRFCIGRAAVNSRDMWRVFRQCGVDALAIVSLTSLLLGLILAFVSSLQLRAFGAEIYVSALVSVSMVRVMGPVLTGIVLAGRTGASFAAIIGSMQANEEVDALITFGLDPVVFSSCPGYSAGRDDASADDICRRDGHTGGLSCGHPHDGHFSFRLLGKHTGEHESLTDMDRPAARAGVRLCGVHHRLLSGAESRA